MELTTNKQKAQQQIEQIDQTIAKIKRSDKFSKVMVIACAVCALFAMLIQAWGLALFVAVCGLLNFIINEMTLKMIPNLEKAKEFWCRLIH